MPNKNSTSIEPPPKPQVQTLFKTGGKGSLPTAEAQAHINGIYQLFQENVKRYSGMIAQVLGMQAQLELTEKMVCLVRDQLELTITQAGCAAQELNWEPAFSEVRFVGVRLTDACMTLLQEHRKLTPEDLLKALNGGMFRFRTSSPLREIHAALLKQKRVKRIGNEYVWAGGGDQISMRPTAVRPITSGTADESEGTATDETKAG